MARRKEKEKKTGVVLLVVVSLLALFVLIGVTYVLVASQYRRSATMDARTKLLHIDPQKHLDRAMYQLVRDTYNTGSVLATRRVLVNTSIVCVKSSSVSKKWRHVLTAM